jgi:hypothetical protein
MIVSSSSSGASGGGVGSWYCTSRWISIAAALAMGMRAFKMAVGEFPVFGCRKVILVLDLRWAGRRVGFMYCSWGLNFLSLWLEYDESQGRNCRRTECNEFLKGDAGAVVRGGGPGLASDGSTKRNKAGQGRAGRKRVSAWNNNHTAMSAARGGYNSQGNTCSHVTAR